MDEGKIVKIAENFLIALGSNFISPGEIGIREHKRTEVIFLRPEALDPTVCIDPPI